MEEEQVRWRGLTASLSGEEQSSVAIQQPNRASYMKYSDERAQSRSKKDVSESAWPREISASMVGSCTNSSYEDLEKVRNLVLQAKAAGLSKFKTPSLVSPGSESIRATAEAAGILEGLRQAGATVMTNSCGPCVGQWDRHDVDVKGAEKNSVVSSFNRNFRARHDSNPGTHSFVTSPELATTFAFSGNLEFNPDNRPSLRSQHRY
ncbi:hypothetical protein diail_10595 [Diaporthe ilicicola]|nr:hypothetical protein diail_10595 [Diaporthe ilicicola]